MIPAQEALGTLLLLPVQKVKTKQELFQIYSWKSRKRPA